MSVPARICTKWSATAAVRWKRGSTATSLAPRRRLASMTKRNPTGWFSAGLPPIARMTSALEMSVQPFVIAPRPNVAAKLATVGPCHIRACCSTGMILRPARKAFWMR